MVKLSFRSKAQGYTGVSINTLDPSDSFAIERSHARGSTAPLELDAEGETFKVERAPTFRIDLKGHGAMSIV
jgi:hypothetical protein